jgi:molecular chaperone GrpE
MRKKHHANPATAKPSPAPQDPGALEGEEAGAAAATVEPAGDAAGTAPEPVETEVPGAVEAAAPAAVAALLAREVEDQKDRLLRLAADFDNFRKRAAREKAEAWSRAQGDLIQKVLEVIDDLGRVAHLDPAQTGAEALHEGMGLVERKFLKVLEGVGLERLDPSGQIFDPNAHEAVMTTPTPTPDLDGTVAMAFQSGYRFNGMLLRPARVSVYAYAEPAPGETVH